MMTREQIQFYSSGKHGMMEPSDPANLRLARRMVAEGVLERRERRVTIPATRPEHAAYRDDLVARDVTLISYHLAEVR